MRELTPVPAVIVVPGFRPSDDSLLLLWRWTTGHIGLIANRNAYRAIGAALARPELSIADAK